MVIDIIFVIALLYGFYLGYARGIISTIFTVLSIIFGLMAAFKFAPATTKFLETAFSDNNPLWFIVGFLLSFVLVMLFIRLIARGLEGILETVNINFINQIAGGVLLAGVMIFMFSVLVWFGDQARLIDVKTKKESLTYAYLEQFPSQAKGVAYTLKPVFEDFWNQSLDVLDRLQEMSEVEENSSVFDIEDEE